MDNPSVPIKIFEINEFKDFLQCFFTVKEIKQVIFTFKSNYLIYEITYDNSKGPI